MATVGNKGKESDELSECSLCRKENIAIEAVKYCMECEEYLCVSCINKHNFFLMSAGHTFLNKGEFGTMTGERVSLSSERCKFHCSNVVDMYCRSHDKIGCSTCMSMNHATCEDVHDIHNFIEKIARTSKEIGCMGIDCMGKLSKALKSNVTLKKRTLDRRDDLIKAKSSCVRAIKDFRKHLNRMLDRLEQSSIDEIENLYLVLDDKLKRELNIIQDMLDELTARRKEMELAQNNVKQEFICSKLCETMNDEAERLCAEPSPILVFSRNLELETTLKSLQSLTARDFSENFRSNPSAGEVGGKSWMELKFDPFAATKFYQKSQSDSTRKGIETKGISQTEVRRKATESKRKQCTDMEEQATSAEDTETLYLRSNLSQQSNKQGLYTITKKEQFNVVHKDDTNFISIISSCILDSGDIVLVDAGNDNLKLVSKKTYKVHDVVRFSSKPNSISCVHGSEAAVCLSNNTIQFVSADDKIVSKQTVKLNHFCRGICIYENEMFVTDAKNHVYIYTLDGKLKKSIVVDLKSDNDFFNLQQSREVAVSRDGKIVYVTDMFQGLIAINRNGKELWRTRRKLDCPNGVCTDGGNNIFVCGVDSYNVVQFGSNGHYEGEILIRSEGLEYTSTVSFHMKDKKIVIGGCDDEIRIYSLK